MVMCDLALFPVGAGSSLSPYVARILEIIDDSALPYRLTPMGTILEGEWEEVMAVSGACFHALAADCERISVSMKIDYRAGTESRLDEKIRAVQRRAGKDFGIHDEGI